MSNSPQGEPKVASNGLGLGRESLILLQGSSAIQIHPDQWKVCHWLQGAVGCSSLPRNSLQVQHLSCQLKFKEFLEIWGWCLGKGRVWKRKRAQRGSNAVTDTSSRETDLSSMETEL